MKYDITVNINMYIRLVVIEERVCFRFFFSLLFSSVDTCVSLRSLVAVRAIRFWECNARTQNLWHAHTAHSSTRTNMLHIGVIQNQIIIHIVIYVDIRRVIIHLAFRKLNRMQETTEWNQHWNKTNEKRNTRSTIDTTYTGTDKCVSFIFCMIKIHLIGAGEKI